VQQLKAANADVLMPSSYTTDGILLVKTWRAGYKPPAIVAQDAASPKRRCYDAVGDKLEGVISRGHFSLDLAAKRPMVGKINAMIQGKVGQGPQRLLLAAQFMGLIVMADAINRAKSVDGDKIREALVATDMPGEQTIMPWKRVQVRRDGQNNDDRSGAAAIYRRQVRHHLPPQAAVADATWPMK